MVIDFASFLEMSPRDIYDDWLAYIQSRDPLLKDVGPATFNSILAEARGESVLGLHTAAEEESQGFQYPHGHRRTSLRHRPGHAARRSLPLVSGHQAC